MFGFSMGEVLLISVIALIAIGPRQLPEVARTVGKLLNELKRATNDFQRAFLDLKDETDKSIHNFQNSVEETLNPQSPSSPVDPVLPPVKVANSETVESADEGEQQMSFDLNKKGP